MDNSYQPVIESLCLRIEALIAKYESVSAENTQLKRIIEKQKTDIQHNKETINELEARINQLQLTEAFVANTTEVDEARRQISKLVREIDKCIALLNE
jgi:archaellum component FlaC